MFNTIYNIMASVYVKVGDFQRNPAALLRKLERGDADSSGSTLRTVGVVVLVLAVFAVIDVAIGSMASRALRSIGSPSFR